MDNAIHRINHYPLNSAVCFVNSYSLDSDISVDSIIQPSNLVMDRTEVDNVIHRINYYPADSVVSFVDTFPLDSDLSGR